MLHTLSPEAQAYYIVYMVYRSTKIEDYHTNDAVMDLKLYREMCTIVEQNMKPVLRFHPILRKAQTIEDIDAEMCLMTFSERAAFSEYFTKLSYLSKYRVPWDPPVKLELSAKPKNLAQFVLEGHFLECCEKHRVLSDSIMYYINKDVYNRIYTLLCEALL